LVFAKGSGKAIRDRLPLRWLTALALALVALLPLRADGATLLKLPGAPPPRFTGNGTDLSLQGGGHTVYYYVRGGFFDACNQHVYNGNGALVGVYIDDQVNQNWPSDATEQNCVRQDVAAGYKLIIAASPLSSPKWNFKPQGATYTAFEWYPYCGSSNFMSGAPVPKKNSYIIQWNFVFSEETIGLGTGNCPKTPRAKINSLVKQIQREKPAMVLYF
jgi:hypothetical protein